MQRMFSHSYIPSLAEKYALVDKYPARQYNIHRYDNGRARMSKKKCRRIIAATVLALVIILAFFAFDSRLIIREYDIDAGIGEGMRIALVTDLHSCRDGEGQQKLISAVQEQQPDIVLLGGDIFDDDMPDANARTFLTVVSKDYPCYYVTGNHEYWSGGEDFAAKMAVLEECGIPVLSGKCETLQFEGKSIAIGGVDDPEAAILNESFSLGAQLNAAAEAAERADYAVLLAHRPENIDIYAECGFDLVLSGHAHGGQWRIPGIMNGLYAPNQGFFPEYAGGRYEKDGTTMIVSRGLARESTRIPRIFNRPELVMVDIK